MGWIVICLAPVVVYRMAEVERRHCQLWAAGALVSELILWWGLGVYYFAAAPMVVVGAFVALWIAKTRDERRRVT